MKTMRKGATMTFLVSIWIGLIIAAVMLELGGSGDASTAKLSQRWTTEISPILSDPIGQFPTLLKNAFSSPVSALLVSIMIGGTVGLPLLANFLTGGGFSLLFAIPMVFIFALVNIFLLPTMDVINGSLGLPVEFQFLYTIFISTLTIVTILSFTTGRQ